MSKSHYAHTALQKLMRTSREPVGNRTTVFAMTSSQFGYPLINIWRIPIDLLVLIVRNIC